MAGIMSEIEDIVNDHMNRQPYDMVCAVCGEKLSSTKNIDSDKDMELEISPCEKCMKRKYEEGREK